MVCREKKKDYELEVFSTYPLFFWKGCEKCRKEFRRESLWFIERDLPTRSFRRPLIQKYFYCTSCCPTKQDAWESYSILNEKLSPKGIKSGVMSNFQK